MDVGKLSNHVNTVLCVFSLFFLFLIGWEFGLIPYNNKVFFITSGKHFSPIYKSSSKLLVKIVNKNSRVNFVSFHVDVPLCFTLIISSNCY